MCYIYTCEGWNLTLYNNANVVATCTVSERNSVHTAFLIFDPFSGQDLMNRKTNRQSLNSN